MLIIPQFKKKNWRPNPPLPPPRQDHSLQGAHWGTGVNKGEAGGVRRGQDRNHPRQQGQAGKTPSVARYLILELRDFQVVGLGLQRLQQRRLFGQPGLQLPT